MTAAITPVSQFVRQSLVLAVLAIGGFVCAAVALGADVVLSTSPIFKPASAVPDQVLEEYERSLGGYSDLVRSRLVTVDFGQFDRIRANNGASTVHLNLFDDVSTVFNVHRHYESRPSFGAPYTNSFGVVATTGDTEKTGDKISITISTSADNVRELSIQWISWRGHGRGYTVRRIRGSNIHYALERQIESQSRLIDSPAEISLRDGKARELTSPTGRFTARFGPRISHWIKDLHFLNTDIGYVLGQVSGRAVTVFKTLNGGRSWEPHPVQSYGEPYEIRFRDVDFGILRIYDQQGRRAGKSYTCAIYRTSDGAETFQSMSIGPNSRCYTGLEFGEDGTAYALAAAKKNPSNSDQQKARVVVIKSNDGMNWEEFYRPQSFELMPMKIETLDGNIYLTNSNKTVTVVDADGAVISSISTIYPFIQKFQFVSQDILFAKVSDELGSYLVRSIDAGKSWTMLAQGTFKILSARSANEVFIARSLGQVYPSDTAPYIGVIAHTMDAGQSWEESTTIRGLFSAVGETQRVNNDTDAIIVDDTILIIKTAARR